MERRPDFDITVPGEGLPPRAEAAPRSLLVYHHDGADLVPLVSGVPAVLGRGARADLPFRGDRVSRAHARFELNDRELILYDLGSTNGTYVNGVRIDGAARLRVGDEVAMGTVVATVTALVAHADARVGLDDNDAFMQALHAEVVRARAFRRQTTLLMVKDLDERPAEVHRWAGVVRAAARDVDRVGLYQPGQLGVIYAEASRTEATGFAQAVVSELARSGRRLGIGIAVFPENARSVEEMVATACAALARADQDQRIVVGGRAAGVTVIQSQAPESGDDVVVRAPSMVELFRRVDQVALAPVPVLVLGETGTGKEVVARAIHQRSKRKERPLHAINCGAMAPTLMEAELFGHEKGAFSGADRTRKGVFEEADGGTVFLDEIGELSPAAQAALLRVLDAGVIRRLGSSRETTVDVRVIAATNRDLESMVEAGTFRLDLLHRINLITLRIPPLRERLSEILPLCNLFLHGAAERYERDVKGMQQDVLPLLLKYHWPGNVRELRNVMERAVLTALEQRIAPEDLPAKLRSAAALDISGPAVEVLETAIHKLPFPLPEQSSDVPPEDGRATPLPAIARRAHLPPFKDVVTAVEAVRIHQALQQWAGNRGDVALALGLPRRTLDHKIATRGYERTPSVGQLGVMARFSHPDDERLDLKGHVEAVERRLIARALEQVRDDVPEAAIALDLDRRTLMARMERYGLGSPT